MASETKKSYEPNYRQETIDRRVRDHERRITTNERRWLMAKGALTMLAVMAGTKIGIDAIPALL